MGIARRSGTIAGFAIACQLVLGVAAARAGEAGIEAETSLNGGPGSPAAEWRLTGIEVGLGALAMMRRERSEQRRVPRMLPLLATRTERGHVWIGLARNRAESRAPGEVRLELAWMIPIGR